MGAHALRVRWATAQEQNKGHVNCKMHTFIE
jgi:hypothetical protein